MKKFWSYVSNGEYCVGTTGQTVYVFDAITGEEIAKFKDMKLIKKFRFLKVDGAQDEGFCFSKDGKKFYNIEKHNFLHSVIAVYNTDTFERINIVDSGDEVEPKCIESDESGRVFVLGFLRSKDPICGFISKFDDYKLLKI